RDATAEMLPIIFTAGIVVAAGLATLRLASIGFVQTLGPAMAVVVLVSLAVSITFVPACMPLFCGPLFWPGLGRQPKADPLLTRAGELVRRGVVSGTSRRLVALPTVAIVVAALVLAASGMGFTRLALTRIRGLRTRRRRRALRQTPSAASPAASSLRRSSCSEGRDRSPTREPPAARPVADRAAGRGRGLRAPARRRCRDRTTSSSRRVPAMPFAGSSRSETT